jgi:uncharacterized protein (DUF2147 family)
MKKILAFLLLVIGIPAFAESSPIGKWNSYDHEGHLRGIVRFSMSHDGTLIGTIYKPIAAAKGKPFNPICTQCTGVNKNRPFKNMIIVWGLEKKGDQWVNGRVLNTDTGKTYRCSIKVSKDNQTIYFHAYVGFSLLGITINWTRAN